MVDDIKVLFGYNITDPDLDTLIIKGINLTLKDMKQWFMDSGITWEVTVNTRFMTISEQEYRDITKASITGDTTTFTGIAGDTIDVTVDGTAYADIDISGDTTIAEVVTAINTAVGATVAFTDDNGNLQITSTTTGASSSVTIADGTSTVQTVIADLFSIVADRTATGIVDVDDILRLTERINDSVVTLKSYEWLIEHYPDPTADYSSTPDYAARHYDRIYFGPTPSVGRSIYIDYIKTITKVVAGDTLPYNDKYDGVLIAGGIEWLTRWMDRSNANAIMIAERNTQKKKDELITAGASNIGQVRQVASREEEDIIAPQVPES